MAINKEYTIRLVEGSKVAALRKPLSSNSVMDLQKSGINAVSINEFHGWTGGDLSFLRSMSFIQELSIVDTFLESKNTDVIHSLSNLTYLDLQTRCKTPIDFDCFPVLEGCFFSWRNGPESLFSRSTLKSLGLMSFKGPELSFLPTVSLNRLILLDSSIVSLSFIEHMAGLSRMRLGALRRLRDTSCMKYLVNLEYLSINGCKGFSSIDFCRNFSKLQYLHMEDVGKVDSLTPIGALAQLHALYFIGDVNIVDGKIDFLRHLKNLQYLSFANRRHYDCKLESFTNTIRQYPQSIKYY